MTLIEFEIAPVLLQLETLLAGRRLRELEGTTGIERFMELPLPRRGKITYGGCRIDKRSCASLSANVRERAALQAWPKAAWAEDAVSCENPVSR